MSHRNRYHDNVMGIAPNGAKVPNGVDFWWDEAPTQQDNCWFENGEVTTDPQGPLMPSNCEEHERGRDLRRQVRAASSRRAPAAIVGRRGTTRTLPVVPDAREAVVVAAAVADGACRCGPPARRRSALLAGDCRLVGSTLSCNGLLDRP